MTGLRAVGRLSWAAIGAGLVLAGCGAGAAHIAQLSHSAFRHSPASRRALRPGPASRQAPNAIAMPPNSGGQRCTEVYCVPQIVPRGPANRPAPKVPVVPLTGAQRCTQVYCVPQPVPRRVSSSA